MKALYRILSLLKQKNNSSLSSCIFYMFCFAFSRNAHTNNGPLKVKKKKSKNKQQKNPKQTNKKNPHTKQHAKAITETIYPSFLNSYNYI